VSLDFLLFPVQYAIFDCFVSDMQEFARLSLDLKLLNDIVPSERYGIHFCKFFN